MPLLAVYWIITVLIHICSAWHGTDNVLYHCWPLNATSGRDKKVDCGGLSMDWDPPPAKVEKGQPFNVTYWLNTSQQFYTNPHTFFPGFNESSLREFCSRTCPSNSANVRSDSCCIHHANVHTCHPSITERPVLCGPWVADDGLLSTHTRAEYGPINTVFTAADVRINFEGINDVIAHIEVGNVQIVIGRRVEVTAPIGLIAGVTVPVFVLLLVLLMIAITTVLIVYYIRKRRLFFDESWIISYDSLHRKVTPDQTAVLLGSFEDQYLVKADGKAINDIDSAFGDKSAVSTSFPKTGVHKGQVVAIKMIHKRSSILTKAIRKEVLQVRLMDHPNVCKVIGATLKDPLKQAIITEYCPKGSLRDVLTNEEIPLNWDFRFSFILDIALGMSYLHHKRMCHGRLTSTNCLVDNHWTIKITDFGLPTFRSTDSTISRNGFTNSLLRLKSKQINTVFEVIPTLQDQKRSSVLKIYQPPEIRSRNNSFVLPQQNADVYSFGVLMVEVAMRVDLHNLVEKCWRQQSQQRPTFEVVKKTLYQINPNKESPVDRMMVMMERYSKHLEVLVAERTQELVLERNKTASVLHSMLPQSVASDLIHGKPAPATSYSSATIYFSDIVGFTSFASSSTPMEIVNFLNELYTTFDTILDHFDVYKVETIGDAYMVVSGVPNTNGDSHAGQIASMALELLSASKRFKIPHKPDTKLQIRAGVHTGPVCAGVVGMKMPRYCLFGDTVNTASRMESTSEAMKIQCSSTTHDVLIKLGGFQLESRGSIEVKGKGVMDTWWIEGKCSVEQHT